MRTNRNLRAQRKLARPTYLFVSFVVGASCLLFGGIAHAALTFTYVSVKDGNSSESRMIFDEHHIRMDGMDRGARAATRAMPGREAKEQGAGEHSVILDAALRKMLILEPQKRVYHEMTEADMQQMRARLETMRTQMQERMKNMTPEQRKAMEQMMGGKGVGDMAMGQRPVIRYEALGQKKTVAGYACETFKVFMGDMLTSQTCFSPWSSGIVSKSDVEKFKTLSAEIKKMFDVTGFDGGHDWSKVPGVPVEEVHVGPDGKTVTSTNTLKSVQRGSVPADTFTAPADYKKEDLPGAFGGHGPAGGRAARPRN